MLATYQEPIQSFISYLRFEKRYSSHTLISYATDLEQFFIFLSENFDEPPFDQISSSFVRTWLASLKEADISSKSINRKSSSLKSFFKYLMKQGVILQTPMATISSLKTNKRLPVFVEEQHIQTLFNHVNFPDNWQGKTEKLILQLFYNTGMRLSELINLKESQVDDQFGQLKVTGKGNKERIIPVQNNLISELKAYISEKPIGNARVLQVFVTEKGKPLYPKFVYNLVKKNLSLVTTIEKKSPHILRHSFATHLMNNGAELNSVKELLGHTSLAATQVYTHNTIEKLKEVFKNAHPKA